MKTHKNHGNDREDTGAPPVFVTLDGVLYMLCDFCGNPMDGNSNLYFWQEDEDGKPYNVHLIHYKCKFPFEVAHHGIWSNKGMLSMKLRWDEDYGEPLDAESFLDRPPGGRKRIFVIWDKHIHTVGVSKSISVALKLKPVGGLVSAVTPRWLASNFSRDPIVRRFLETYDDGIWLQTKRRGRSR